MAAGVAAAGIAAGAGIAAAVGVGTAAPEVAAERYADGPPGGHTGGFGEPTCRACHFDGPVDAPDGSLSVTGFPERWAPGERYSLQVRLAHPGLARAGFQLAVRWGDGPCGGLSAGSLETGGNERLRLVAADSGRVRYAQHTLEGSRPAARGKAAWKLPWTAPSSPGPEGGDIVLHVAANAANGDDSEFGDFVYARSLTAEPPTRREGKRWPATACRTRSTSRSSTSYTPPTSIFP